MITDLLAIVNFGLFLFLSGLHFYWAFGGKWFLQYTIPEAFQAPAGVMQKRTTFVLATLAVALGLLLFGLVTLLHFSGFAALAGQWPIRTALFVIAGIFLLRALGDFKYVGFFRKMKTGGFAHWDAKLFSPLCLYLGLSSFWIAL